VARLTHHCFVVNCFATLVLVIDHSAVKKKETIHVSMCAGGGYLNCSVEEPNNRWLVPFVVVAIADLSDS